MAKFLPVVISILVITGLAAVVVYFNSDDPDTAPEITPTPTMNASLPPEFTLGDSRFSQGSCTSDEDCIISGCSSEVCGNEEAVTTCEFSEDFPNDKKYDCGCVNNVCGWSN